MRLICVDDEIRVLRHTVLMCQELPDIEDTRGFSRAGEALEWVKGNPVDAALLDIDMPDMNGLTLAARIKEVRPDVAIIFVTAFAQFAVDSFAVHPTGYLLKPIDQEDIARELAYVRSLKTRRAAAHIAVYTFGDFEILLDGEMLSFRRAKSKELLAYLVDRHGKGVTRAQIYAALWEEGDYGHSQQKYLDVVIRSLRETLEKHGIGDIMEMKSGFLRIRPEMIDCDLYRFLDGESSAVNAYRGAYMSNYPWATFSEAGLTASRDK